MAIAGPRPLLRPDRARFATNSARRSNSAGWPRQSRYLSRLAPTCEWDVAAGHAIVTAAGGRITDAHGADLQFGKGSPGFIVPEFIAWGDPESPRAIPTRRGRSRGVW